LRHVLVQGEGHGIEVMTPGSGPVHKLLLDLGFTGVPDRLRMELGTYLEVAGFETYGLSPYLVT
jgi:hypothetical protein